MDAYSQGVRVHWVLGKLPGGTGVAAGYQFLGDAVNARTRSRLPYAPRHSATIRTWWAPSWLQLALEMGSEAIVDRVGVDGRPLPHQVLLHWSIRKTLGPVDVLLAVDDATRTLSPQTGPREGRSIRALVRAARW